MVVAGGSAEAMLDGMAGSGSGGVQRKAVQADMLGDIKDAVVGAVEGVLEWIDLLAPKQAILDQLSDTSWIMAAKDSLEYEAHPDHAPMLELDLWMAVLDASVGVQALADRVKDCDDEESVSALDTEVKTWRESAQEDLELTLELVVDDYRDIEKSWLMAFATGPAITADPVNPNQAGQSVKLTLHPGMLARTVVETTVSWTFGRTAKAKKAKVKKWSGRQKKRYKQKFQKQLDDVWGPSAQAFDPFRVSDPPDYLLADDGERWSEITSEFEGKISDAAAGSAHFAITVDKEARGESNRASVGTGDAEFFYSDQNAGYDRRGNRDGSQHTLAHEWMHMVGNADEYAENSKDDTDEAIAGDNMGGFQAQYKKRYGDCVAHFDDIIANKAGTYTKEQIAQAKKDKDSVVDAYGAGSDGSKINDLATPSPDRVGSAPDVCFATRNVYDPAYAARRERVAERERARLEERATVQLSEDVDKYALTDLPDIDCASRISLCGARCCALSFALGAQDLEERAVEWDYRRPYVVRQRADGFCVHNSEDSGCGVYAQRPATCRSYDCRQDDRIWIDFEARIPRPTEPGE